MSKVTIFFCLILVASTAAGAAPERESITIYSDGIELAGDIWRPQDRSPAQRRPGLLLIHGWGGLKSHLNQAYAPQFAALGYVVLTFDYTGWGDSDGVLIRKGERPDSARGAKTAQTYATEVEELRQMVNPLEQLDDIRAAFAYLATDPAVDTARMAVWGSSLGGGLALATATEFSDQVKVLISQVGAVNPQAGLRGADPADPLSPANVAKWRGAMARGEVPSFPNAEAPGLQGYPEWPDYVRYRPMADLDALKAATLIVDAADEELFKIKDNGAYLYSRIHNRLPARYETLPGKHYDIYRDEGYKAALMLESQWLQKHLPVTKQ